ncbi:MAG TPA: hypothetical protein VHB46_01710 [Burkholderiales bacterium]|nr:hypothetical protein [Burkholderiales bacterium]
MSKTSICVFLLLVLGATAGCTTFLIEGSGERDKTPQAQKVEETVHGSFWGFDWSKRNVVKCDKDNELYRIKVHQNALFVLASVATLGLYVPQSVESWCVAREDSSKDEGPSLKLKKRATDQGG